MGAIQNGGMIVVVVAALVLFGGLISPPGPEHHAVSALSRQVSHFSVGKTSVLDALLLAWTR